ncbi:MAG: PBP1A family penicillin-binding protein [Alphaproteobacteria bacterium]|nr:PBP1A family penicillin-binding protein [Alphaproteobacteria bacterium]
MSLHADPTDRPARPRKPPPGTKPAGTGKARRKERPKGPGKKRSPFWRIVSVLLAAGVWAGVAVLAVVAWYASDLPSVDSGAATRRRPSVTLLSSDGQVVAAVGDVYGDPLRLSEMPPYLPKALLSIEDRRFYSHFGIDPIGLARAAFVNLRAGHVVQGGSTLTQQVAKNLFLTPERHFKRKVQELLLALWLEHTFTKDQILTLYLNRVYLGSGSFGVDAAAHRYFGRSAREVTLYQAAMLAGLPKAPSRYNPARDLEAADRRARQVLAAMVDAGMLEERQAKAVQASAETATAAAQTPTGPYFADWLLGQIPSFIGPIDRDLVVVTTLDRAIQVKAEDSLEALLGGRGAKARVSQGAAVVLGIDGAVRAMVGGREYGDSQFNRAVLAQRQPGSAFKPFVFLAGLESGLTPESMVLDAPVSVGGWKPKNFSGKYEGEVTMAHALAHSINTATVRIADRAGLKQVAKTARRFGLPMPEHPDASISLGTSEVDLLSLTAAYAPFANGGFGVLPFGVIEIRERGGQVLYRREGQGPGRVLDSENLGAMNRMLAGVVAGGTARKAALDRPAAGKTGTTQDFRDAWFVGFTADYVAGVWLGNDDNKPMKAITGGSLPAQLWREVMVEAHKGLSLRSLPGAETPSASVAASGDEPVESVVRQEDQGFLDNLLRDVFGN